MIGSIIGGIAGYYSAKEAAKQQREALAQAKGEVGTAYGEAAGYQQPYYKSGLEDYQTLRNMVRGGQFDMPTERFTFAEQQPGAYQEQPFRFEADPGYQFRLQEGMRAIEGSAAARGGGLSGATLKALQKYGSGLASQEYGAAYGRYAQNRAFGADQAAQRLGQYNINRAFGYGTFADEQERRRLETANRYNRMAGLGNVGFGAASSLANLGVSRGQTMADLAIQMGNVNAAEALAKGQAFGRVGQDISQQESNVAMMLPYLV